MNSIVAIGPPKIAVVSENINAVHELIMQDRHVTCREIKASLGISSTSIHSILQLKKICSRWIRHNLTIPEKRFVIVTGGESWMYAYEPAFLTGQNV